MSEHPILYSTPMVQANIELRKTMTRRMTGLDKVNIDPDNWESIATYHVVTKGYFEVCFEHKKTKEKIYCHAPYGLPGDLLWVRESFAPIDHPELKYRYKADHLNPKSVSWNPSIHMPKSASRIWLEVEEIRVERLNDISEEDTIAEGVKYDFHEGENHFYVYPPKDETKGIYIGPCLVSGTYVSVSSAFGGDTPWKFSFKSLFFSVNGYKPKPQREFGEKGKIVSYTAVAWDQKDFDTNWAKYHGIYRNKPLEVIINPWVWVVKYKVLSTKGRPENV